MTKKCFQFIHSELIAGLKDLKTVVRALTFHETGLLGYVRAWMGGNAEMEKYAISCVSGVLSQHDFRFADRLVSVEW